ncbi:MAG: prephenate dehydrogenase [Planctomycetia bacterium]|nr:prephenate dehydrogenase [Planctomycetia bacterium]
MVAIIGVGLIGGSIGLALRRRQLAGRVVGIGRSRDSLETARRIGAVDEITTDVAKGVAGADLVVVCTPVGRIVEHVRLAAEHCREGALITDAGSTKAQIVRGLRRFSQKNPPRGVRFVGSHPLAGSERSGPAEAQADLFVDHVVVVTPLRSTPAGDIAEVREFWESLGARTVTMSPSQHDRALAATSHVPHLVAAALSASVPEAYRELAAGGLRDTTRIAAGDPELWRQIFSTNRRDVLRSLQRFQKTLRTFQQALRSDQDGRLAKLLAKGKKHRDALGN